MVLNLEFCVRKTTSSEYYQEDGRVLVINTKYSEVYQTTRLHYGVFFRVEDDRENRVLCTVDLPYEHLVEDRQEESTEDEEQGVEDSMEDEDEGMVPAALPAIRSLGATRIQVEQGKNVQECVICQEEYRDGEKVTFKGFEGITSTMSGKGEMEEAEGLQKDGYHFSKLGGGKIVVDSRNSYWINFNSCSRKRARIYSTASRADINGPKSSCSEITIDGSLSAESQDADYSYIPSLSYDLEDSIIARFPLLEYWKLCFVNKRLLALLLSGELFNIRRKIQFDEPSVFMFASGESSWLAFDREFKSCRRLPVLPADMCFFSGDKESFCAGTHLLISGREIEGLVIWRRIESRSEPQRNPSGESNQIKGLAFWGAGLFRWRCGGSFSFCARLLEFIVGCW
ncbi:hypothetical protein ACET3Z_022282 [Daucus carota]